MPSRADPRLSIVIPVYNEPESIGRTLDALVASVTVHPLEVLVVYDSEEDTTLPVLRARMPTLPELHLHRNDLGRGVLNALRSGFAAANAPFVLVTMADLSDNPADINSMYQLAAQGADLVVASRYVRGGQQLGGPALKGTLSRLAGLSLHWLGGLPTRDPTNNFKLYSKRLLQHIPLRSSGGFEVALELTVKAHLAGLRIVEIPTTWRDRASGDSHFQLRKWLPHYLRWYTLGLTSRARLRGRGAQPWV